MKSKSLASLQETTIAKIVGLAVGFFFAFASPIDTVAEAHAGSGRSPRQKGSSSTIRKAPKLPAQEIGVSQSALKQKNFKVGHTILLLDVPGSLGETRPVAVHLWYPGDKQPYNNGAPTTYTSALVGVPLIEAQWDPLSWEIQTESARENIPIYDKGPPFSVIIFSHGSTNDPIDYAYTLENLASEGFVVAAPAHVNNTQDDVRVDFINEQAGFQLLACLDGRAPPCSRDDVPANMNDRVRDITYVLDALPGVFGDRVDATEAGVMGHSRGTATALAIAGGSTTWGITPDPRIKAIMTMAAGAPSIIFSPNLSEVVVPALLVAGGLDRTTPQAISESVFDQIASDEKLLVTIPNAVHRSFDSAFCALMREGASIAQANPRAILERHLSTQILIHATSGVAMDYCSFDSFINPDIRPFVASLTGFDVTETNVPVTTLDSDEVKRVITELAAAFFGTVLPRTDKVRPHFKYVLSPKWLVKHEPIIGTVDAFIHAEALCPGGKGVCPD
jgi:predicted dienelactone hydrolase